MALLLISHVIVPASDKLSRKRAFTKRLGLQSMFHMVIQKTIYGGECASARVNEWVSEYVISNGSRPELRKKPPGNK